MVISELIEHLENIRRTHGDVIVRVVWDHPYFAANTSDFMVGLVKVKQKDGTIKNCGCGICVTQVKVC
jgi:hypothetical protein